MRYLQSKNFYMSLTIVGIFVITSALVGFLVFKNRIISNDKALQSLDYCNNDKVGEELKSGFPNFTAEDIPEMEQVIDRVQQTSNYLEGVNCLYVLGKHAAFSGNYTKASEYYDKLLSINKKSGDWIDGAFSRETPEDIVVTRNFLAEQDKKLKDAVLRQNFILPREKAPTQ
jgi:hypothetical protein